MRVGLLKGPCCLLAHSKVDDEIVDLLNAENDDCVAATHDWASLTAAMLFLPGVVSPWQLPKRSAHSMLRSYESNLD